MSHCAPGLYAGLSLRTESAFSESASTLELDLPGTRGAQGFTRKGSIYKADKRDARGDWRGEQLAGSCIPQGSAARGQYANWARPPDDLMGSAFSFQSELLESYTPSLHSGVDLYQSFCNGV